VKNEDESLTLENGVIVPEKARMRAEVYTRAVGFLRPVESFHDGKKAEFKDRKTYKVNI